MKFPQLTALVPQNEHFDETAVTGEGVWLSVGHVNALEESLAGAQTALETANAATATATASESLTAAQTENATLTQERDELTAQVTALTEQVAKLQKQPSGTGTTVPTKKDENQEQKPTPSYLRDDSPENAWLDKQLKFR